jgi:hypothetical protein
MRLLNYGLIIPLLSHSFNQLFITNFSFIVSTLTSNFVILPCKLQVVYFILYFPNAFSISK